MSKRTAGQDPLNVQLPVIQLALDKILVDESKNLRHFAPDAKTIEKLADSIKDNGMWSPVLVRPLPEPVEGCTHVLVAGYQRMKAVAHLNEKGHHITEVSASVKEVEGGVGTQEEQEGLRSQVTKILNLKENLERSEISYIDAAYAIKELQESGMTNTDIAKEFGKSGAWVGYVVKMLGLRSDIQKKIHSGVINFRLAKTLPELSEEEQDARIAEVESGEASGSQAAKKAKAGKKRKNNRGRKGQEDAVDSKNISSKQAILQLEEMVETLSAEPEEKWNKAKQAGVEYAIGLYKDVVKFLSGGIGVKALHNRVMKGV